MNAHVPFIRYRDRPVSIDEGSREVWLPHETGVSLTTRDHPEEYKRVSMADLMTETNYLNPDVEFIAEINTPESFQTFAEVLNTGHGVIGTTHAADVETLINRVVEQDVPTYLLDEVDALVFPRHVGGERYVGEVVEFVDEDRFRELERDREDGRCGVVRNGPATVYWNSVAHRRTDGSYAFAYDHPDLGDDERRSRTAVFESVAGATDQQVEAVEADFRRKHRYVRYLEREGIADGDALFEFLADLRTDEAATVERIQRHTDPDTATATSPGDGAVELPDRDPEREFVAAEDSEADSEGTDDIGGAEPVDQIGDTEPAGDGRNDAEPDGDVDCDADGSDDVVTDDSEAADGDIAGSGEAEDPPAHDRRQPDGGQPTGHGEPAGQGDGADGD
jgi:hypothetical protein